MSRFFRRYRLFLLSTAWLLVMFNAPLASADSLTIAVASNFSGALHTLAERFEEKTGNKILISSASTGKHYTQIQNGAPFDVFMSADEKRVDMLIAEGRADAAYTAVYALGKLVLISNIAGGECRDVFSSDKLRHFAIANPGTAPYGVAAQQVLEHLGLWKKLQGRLVMGENIAQTLQFVVSTSADAGLVAKSMLIDNPRVQPACVWQVPDTLYQPIKQKMAVLKQSQAKPAVLAFWEFMQSAEAAVIIRDSGYDVL
jgi:molybdate transport system substrate-binding protein